jgi:hypothetical protein
MKDIHKKQARIIAKDNCHELRCWCLCYEFLCCGRGLCFHIMYVFVVSDVTRLAVRVYCSNRSPLFSWRFKCTREGPIPGALWSCEIVWHTACQHSPCNAVCCGHARKTPSWHAMSVQVVCCVNEACTWVIGNGRAESRGSPLFNIFTAATDCIWFRDITNTPHTFTNWRWISTREKDFTRKNPITLRQKGDSTPLV